MEIPICPKCGYPIIDKFTIEVETDIDGAVELVEGECMNCEVIYQYENVYVYSHTRNVKELFSK